MKIVMFKTNKLSIVFIVLALFTILAASAAAAGRSENDKPPLTAAPRMAEALSPGIYAFEDFSHLDPRRYPIKGSNVIFE